MRVMVFNLFTFCVVAICDLCWRYLQIVREESEESSLLEIELAKYE